MHDGAADGTGANVRIAHLGTFVPHRKRTAAETTVHRHRVGVRKHAAVHAYRPNVVRKVGHLRWKRFLSDKVWVSQRVVARDGATCVHAVHVADETAGTAAAVLHRAEALSLALHLVHHHHLLLLLLVRMLRMLRHWIAKVHVTGRRRNLLRQTDGAERRSRVIVRAEQQREVDVALDRVVCLLAAAAAAPVAARAARARVGGIRARHVRAAEVAELVWQLGVEFVEQVPICGRK